MKQVGLALLLALVAILLWPLRGQAMADNSLNVAGYCKAKHGTNARSEGRDWFCGKSTFSVSLDEVCRWQNGAGYRATSENVLNPDSWTCEQPTTQVTIQKLSAPFAKSQASLDIYRYCIAQGLGEPSTSGRDWYCSKSNFNLSLDEVCRWQNGAGYRATSEDYMNPFSWQCVK